MHETGFQKVKRVAGGRNIDVALLIGISDAAVSMWKGTIPPDKAIALEKALDGVVTRYEMRPDHFGEPRPAPKKARRAA